MLKSAPTVPGAVPVDSIVGSSYEQRIGLSWREPLHTYGIIRQYEVRESGRWAPPLSVVVS